MDKLSLEVCLQQQKKVHIETDSTSTHTLMQREMAKVFR